MNTPKVKTAAAIPAAKRNAGEARLVWGPEGVLSVKTKAIYLKKGVKIFWGGEEIKFN